MTKKQLLTVLFLSITFVGYAQTDTLRTDTTYWQKSFNGGINFNQASFSSNWAGGGVNSISLGGLINGRALYQKEKWSWDNVADLQLGFVKQQNIGVRKAADQLYLNSVAGYKIANHLDLFMSGTFNSFFAAGYKYGERDSNNDGTKDSDLFVSRFFSPAFLTFAWGLAYKPVDWFSLRVSPFAPRFTFVTDDAVRYRETVAGSGVFVQDPTAVAYGVAAGKTVRTEWLAFQLQSELNKDIAPNVNLKVRYQMFLNYETFDPDHRLDISLTAKINRFFSSTFGLTSIYDSDISGDIQVQQVLGIGFLYNVTTFKETKK
ncbi:DUF3078 domain-containing protein [Xanthocytophaga agilis]|uniref:DUF3078 domain-containing protein n=1 Tax=Xanthocytophaga agilis TaxID=3048010 RepID=A0AAE3R8F1_9BACT|nr:DUF3078 domain-containing protein [Xanthocytophaga agilis]MDJ1503320.1 DUF3078 domain-containing protein [Xanthocytophaga agilis]